MKQACRCCSLGCQQAFSSVQVLAECGPRYVTRLTLLDLVRVCFMLSTRSQQIFLVKGQVVCTSEPV